MTKFTAVLSISLIIFLFSVGLSLVWYSGLFEDQTLELVKEVSNPEVIQTTTCELLEKPDFYDGKLVRFDSTAFLNGFGEIILSPKDCYLNVADHTFRLARMEIGETDSSNKVLRSSIDAIKRLSNGENKEVDVLVLGRASKTRDSKNRIDVSIQPLSLSLYHPSVPWSQKLRAKNTLYGRRNIVLFRCSLNGSGGSRRPNLGFRPDTSGLHPRL